MNRIRIALVLAVMACLCCPAAFASDTVPENAAQAPVQAPADALADALADAPVDVSANGAILKDARPASEREIAFEAGVTVVRQSYFTNALLLTRQDAATGSAQTSVVTDADLSGEYVPQEGETPAAPQEDPWEGFNRAMFDFNDTLYFWVYDPVATGYSILVPQPARVGVANVYENVVRFPIRFVNNILQGKLENSFRELLRFVVNTVFGLGGLVESSRDHAYLNPPKQDLGRTFRSWGIGQGNYVVWPVFGPYTIRETFGDVGDAFAWPPTYIRPWYWSAAIWTHEKTNLLSLHQGDYEALKEASLDPYVALRDAYLQYRNRKDYDPYYDRPEDKPADAGRPFLRTE